MQTRTSLSITWFHLGLVSMMACAEPQKKIPLNFGLLVPSSIAGDKYANGAKLALAHIRADGGLRDGGELNFITVDPGTDAAGAEAALQQLIDEQHVVGAAVFLGNSLYGSAPMTGAPIGAGPAAARAKVPVFCVTCGTPNLDFPLVQSAMGATVSDLDPNCTTSPPAPACTATSTGTCCRAQTGKVVSRGYALRTYQVTSLIQGKLVAEMAIADGVESAAALVSISPVVPGSMPDAFRTNYTAGGKTYVRTEVLPMDAAQTGAALQAAMAPSGATSVGAVVISAQPQQTLAILDAYAMLSSPRPQLYISSSGYSPEALRRPGLLGAKGVTYAVAAGPSPGTWVADYAAAYGVRERDVIADFGVDASYDMAMVMALAIYATGKANPTAEEINAHIDVVNTAGGTPIGYREFAKAKQVLDEKGTIDYQGVSSTVDFGPQGSVPSTITKWRAVEQDGSLAYEYLP